MYSVKELEEKGHLKKGSAQLEDAVLIQEVIDQYRDKDTLQYQKMKALETAAYYDEAGKMQRLKEQFSNENGVLNIRGTSNMANICWSRRPFQKERWRRHRKC